MTKIIGLTGQIGSGKSLAASILANQGAAIIDADALARQVVEPGQPAYEEIHEAFGSEYVLPQGGLNRKALATLVFSNEEARRRLNDITHPRIREQAQCLIERYRSEGWQLIVLEAALLIGSSFTDMLDEIWLITAPAQQIYNRLTQRDGLSDAEITSRLKAQLSPEVQATTADHVITNDSNAQNLSEQLYSLTGKILT